MIRHHSSELDKFSCGRLQLSNKPADALRLKNEPKEPAPKFFAGEIRANRQNHGVSLDLLPQKIVQFTSVLPDHLRSRLFSVDIVSCTDQKHAHVECH
jgi:hypothetical protein